MANKDDERVMCIKARSLEAAGPFTGLTEDWEKYVPGLLTQAHVRWLRRGDCETDPEWKQIIPYLLLTHERPAGVEVAIYQRTPMSGEERLHGKWSLGIGGHINENDISAFDGALNEEDAPINTFRNGWQRELEEEVRMDSKYAAKVAGLIYDPVYDVGRVHLGILVHVQLQLPAVYPRDEEISKLHFVSHEAAIASSAAGLTEFEEWSRIVLNSEFAGRGFRRRD